MLRKLYKKYYCGCILGITYQFIISRIHVSVRANNRWNPTYLVQTGQNGLSSIQTILRCTNLLLPFVRASRKICFNYQPTLQRSYGDIQFSKSKSHLQQHFLFSFIVNGKHIVDKIGTRTKPQDRLLVLLYSTLYVHYLSIRSRASSDGTLGIVMYCICKCDYVIVT
jgi:hypothetical protein